MNVEFPRRLSSDFEGYSFLVDLYQQTKNLEFSTLILDFSYTTWFEANLCAALGAILNHVQDNLNTVELINLQPAQHDIFCRNHFLASFGGEKITDHYETTIKYRRNKLAEEKLIHRFLNDELLGKQDFPRLSTLAHKEIERNIFEIFSNAIIHGDCDYVHSCGQYYPQKQPPRIDFTIVDMGKTIKKNVNDFLGEKLSAKKAIEWAIVHGNTTKPKERNIPGGLGFEIILKFLKLNNGKIQIVSSNGYWEFKRGKIRSNKLNNKFPGTIVNLEFNIDDDSFYFLEGEKNQEIIF